MVGTNDMNALNELKFLELNDISSELCVRVAKRLKKSCERLLEASGTVLLLLEHA